LSYPGVGPRPPRGPGQKPGASLYTRKRLSRIHHGTRANAWCLLMNAEASLSHGPAARQRVRGVAAGQHLRGRAPVIERADKVGGPAITHTPTHGGRKPVASLNTRKRHSLTGARAKAWCLLTHAEASLSLMGVRAKAWSLLTHAKASLTLSLSNRRIELFAKQYLPNTNCPRYRIGPGLSLHGIMLGEITVATPVRPVMVDGAALG